MAKNKNSNPNKSTQKFLNIAEIKDDIVIMNDGSLLKILMISSINFYLKSEDEQKALISGYVQFLNSLDFPLQIIIQSRKLNIESYLSTVKDAERKQTNELLKMQTKDYIEFVGQLVELTDIMSKKFFIVVAYSPLKASKKSFYNRLMEVLYPAAKVVLNEEKFNKYKLELDRRVDRVGSGLSSLGLNIVPLDTQGLIELYYNSYNPAVSEKERITDINKLNIENNG